MFDILNLILINTLVLSSVLILAALGGMFSEKSGIINIGLEGIMTFSAFVGAAVIASLESHFFDISGILVFTIGILAAIIGGVLFALLHAILTIKYKVDQIISGTVINILGLALAMFLTKSIFGSSTTPGIVHNPVEIIGIPIIVILAFLVVPLCYFIIEKTKFGLRIKASGENPEAAQSMGIKVNEIRFRAVLISGVFASIGGVILVITSVGIFSSSVIAGKGFIALAVLIFGRWKPVGILLAGLLFGFLTTLGAVIPTAFPGIHISATAYNILPYLLTIIALVIFSKRSQAPEALGREYSGE